MAPPPRSLLKCVLTPAIGTEKVGNSEVFLKVLFKPKMSPPPKPPFLWGGGRRLPFKESGILSKSLREEKTLGASFGYQLF